MPTSITATRSDDSITAVMVYTGPGTSSSQPTVLIADFNRGLGPATDLHFWLLVVRQTRRQRLPTHTGTTVKLAQGPDGAIYQLTFAPAGTSPYGDVTGLGALSSSPHQVGKGALVVQQPVFFEPLSRRRRAVDPPRDQPCRQAGRDPA